MHNVASVFQQDSTENLRHADLCLELDIGVVAGLLVLRHARVPELEEHFAPENSSCVHVGHRDYVLYIVSR